MLSPAVSHPLRKMGEEENSTSFLPCLLLALVPGCLPGCLSPNRQHQGEKTSGVEWGHGVMEWWGDRGRGREREQSPAYRLGCEPRQDARL